MADIPINAVDRRVQFSGNTGTGPFAFTFNILVDADLAVFKNSTLLTLGSGADYTISTNADGTGSVTLTGSNNGTALITTDLLTIVGGRQLARTTDFVTAGDLLASSLNEQLDSNVIMVQQLDEKFTRALRINQFDATADMTLPDKATRAGKLFSFDSNGLPDATAGKVDTVTASASGLSAGASPTATATFTASSGALSLAFGIPAGATGAAGPAGADGADGADGGGLADVVSDTTPQLGGDLDMNGNDIVTTSNATIDLAPNGTGTVVVRGNTNPGTIVFNCESNSHGQTVKAQPHSAAVTNTLTLPAGGNGELVSTVATQELTNKVIPDDENLSFGTDSDAFIKYDETSTDHLKIGGAVTTFEKAAVGATDTDTTNTGNVTLDFDANQNFVLTLTGNVTLVNPSTENVGQSGFIVFIQDATGGRTVSTSTDYETAGGSGLTLSSAASTTDIVPYVVAASNRILLGAPQLAFA